MFRKILEDALKKNPDVEEAIGEGGAKELDAMLGGVFGDLLKDMPQEMMAEAVETMGAGMQAALDDVPFDIKTAQEKVNDDQAIMYAKWLNYMSLTDEECVFERMEDYDHHLEAARALKPSKRQVEMDLLYQKNAKTWNKLMETIESSSKSKVFEKVQALLQAGEDPNSRSFLKDTAMGLAYYNDYMDTLKLLLDHGGKLDAIGWTGLHYAIAFGTLEDVKAALPSDVVGRKDDKGNTAVDLCAQYGDAEKLVVVLAAEPKGRVLDDNDSLEAMCVAIGKGDFEQVKLFLAAGVDPNGVPDYGPEPIDCTKEEYDLDMLQVLIDHGADVTRIESLNDYHEKPERIVDENGVPKIIAYVRALYAAGWHIGFLDEHERDDLRFVTGAALVRVAAVSKADFKKHAHPRFGVANPEKANVPFWRQMIRSGASGYAGRKEFGTLDRNYTEPAVWSFDRFGMSTTHLPDGRWIQIAGEHEDHYDADFNIYNDVIVHDGKGGVDIYCYPRADFEPTDFHTATLFDDHILIIGNCGYQGDRRVGETPVYRLNLSDFSMQAVKTTGDNPGWINRHRAEVVDGEIIVSGGQIQSETGYGDYGECHALRIHDMVWRKVS